MKKFIVFVISVALILSLSIPTSLACTVFSGADGQNVFFGNNEDWFEKDTYVWFVPASQKEYGRVCLGFENAHPQGGLNDQGLAIDWVAFKNATDDNLAPVIDTKANYYGDINDALLSTCANVDDVISFYQKYNDVNTGYATLYAADKTGVSVKIAWDHAADDLEVRKSSSEFNSLGYGEYVINSMCLTKNVSEAAVRDMLKASAQSELTLYSNIFNLKTGDVTLFHNQNFDRAVKLNLSEELGKGAHVVDISSLFGDTKELGSDLINPQTLLPIYTRIIIYILGLYMLFCSVYFAISLIKEKERTKMKMTTHLTAVIAGVIAVVIMFFLYYRWSFLLSYGFAILGSLPHMLAWMLMAITLLQIVLCVVAFVRKRLTKGKRIVYLISSILLLMISAEMLINGFLR